MRWYRFDQNNVMGVFTQPACIIYTFAADLAAAREKLMAAGAQDDYCECCGHRWGIAYEVDEGERELLEEGRAPWADDGRDDIPGAIIV